MDRRALIVGAPYNDLPGVRQDIVNYTNFLLSPLGGSWQKEEISVLESPTHQQLSAEVKSLQRADYSFVVFSGHGYHPRGAPSARILLRHAVEIDSDDLRKGARKHTLILDCCRKLETESVMDSVAKRALREQRELNPQDCRKFFDIELSKCGDGLVVLHACGLDELASETESQGGYYSRALTSAAREWESQSPVHVRGQHDTLSVVHAHDRATKRVLVQSGDRQHPEREQPRTPPHFPFAIIA